MISESVPNILWSSIGTRISTILNGENFQRTATVALCLTGRRRTESSKLI